MQISKRAAARWLLATLLVFCALTPLAAQESPFGLQTRTHWTSSRVIGFPDPPPSHQLVRAFPDLSFRQPIACGRFPNSDVLWVATHESEYGGKGAIWKFENDQRVSKPTLLLEIPEIIYGLAFHPDFHTNGLVFIGCNGRSESLGTVATKVLRAKLTTAPPYIWQEDATEVVIEWASNGHNGGDVAFGPDGMLFVSAGDGTSDSDGNLTGQDLTNLPGSILRIDVDHPTAERLYSVPADNPFLSIADARPEIWAYGLRNPWRIAFDAETGELWVGNNGQDLWETVHLIRRGDNCGWSLMEGNVPFQPSRPRGPTPVVPATIAHHHSEARSLTGGLVYYGRKLPELRGAYLYGDYSTGNIWAARHADGRTTVRHIARSSVQVAGFGLDSAGEPIIVDHGGGLYRVAANTQPATHESFPRRLSETGLFASVADHKMAPGVIPYSVNSPLWSDGAAKQRFLAVPGEKRVTFKNKGSWDFPDGSVLVKTFSLPFGESRKEPIETRLLTRQDGEWFGYSYRWNQKRTDATLVEAVGRDEPVQVWRDGVIAEQLWRYPSRSECMVCHTRAANFVLGVSTEQLNRTHAYDVSTDNQIRTLNHIGLFTARVAQSPEELPRLADPADPRETLSDRARSYLHANCANCHVSAAGGNSRFSAVFDQPLEKLQLIDRVPEHDRFDIDTARVIAPGVPERSVLLKRISLRGRGQMPPLASHLVDADGVRLLTDWVRSLKSPGP